MTVTAPVPGSVAGAAPLADALPAATPPEVGPGRAAGGGVVRALLRRPSSVVAWSFLAVVVLASVAAPLLAPAAPTAQDFNATLLAPGAPGHLAGTDNLGRDQLSRLLYGGRPIIVTA